MAELIHRVTSPVTGVEFLLRRMSVKDELGCPFEAHLELYSDKRNVAGTDALGKPLVVKIRKPDGEDWVFHGLVSRFVNFGATDYYQIYHVTLRPWLWFLTRTSDCRIFQQLAVPDILEDVFKKKNGFSDFKRSLNGSYNPVEYCVQYRESDFDFVQRLMEAEGIYYFFDHTGDGGHTLVLSDSPASHPPLKANAKLPFRRRMEEFTGTSHIFDWTRIAEVQTGAYVLTDFDFEKPKASLQAKSLVNRSHTHAGFERYDYPGEYKEAKAGEQYAKIRLDELQSQFTRIEAQGICHDLAVGHRFQLEEYPLEAENGEYLIVSQEITIESGEAEHFGGNAQNLFAVRLTAIESKQAFRPVRRTAKPIVQGPQTAIVVGKSAEEIWTDKYGRVKVQFHWDRVGKKDENSSCWVRVAQVWSGKNWGGIHVPRIGQEVIVDFLEGDPDRPIITGRVYNFDQMPPYTLPANGTQSGLKTMSSKEGTKDTFNELRFEDKKDAEQVYFHAEKNFDRVVENNDTLKVGFEKKDKGDQTVEIFNNQKTAIGTKEAEDGSQTIEVFNNQSLKVGCQDAKDGSQTIEIWKDRTETVKEGDELVTIEKGNRDVVVKKGNDTHVIETGNREVTIKTGHDTLTISKGNLTIQIAKGKCSIEAAQAIELTVGGSSISIDPTSITLKSQQINVQADTKAAVESAMTSISGKSMVQVQGGMVKIN